MIYVLDASVVVAALREREPGHRAALKHCLPLFERRDHIVVPAVFDLEVTSALIRCGAEPDRVTEFFADHLESRRLVTIGPRAVRAVAAVVRTTRLRAADALYVWVAAREGIPLVTADEEMLTRAHLYGVTAVNPSGAR